jgi:hypothetical protein
MTFVVPVLLTFACLGAGALLLFTLRLLNNWPILEKVGLAFALGFGFIGWLFFWLGAVGWYSPEAAWVVCGLLAMALVPLRQNFTLNLAQINFSALEWVLFGLIAVAMAADFLEALAPPVEADSLAYHFQLPKQFIVEGRLIFVPRALDGAVPLLMQMTYVAVLLLGGNEDVALTLWTFVSGWAPGFLLFAFSRRWLPRHWSLALLLLFQTLPAMLYGAGSGHIEPRLAMFVLIAAFGFVALKDNPRFGPILLIGMGSGLYAASKYTGLLFVAAAGISLLICSGRYWFRNGVVCGLVVLVVGGQWYGWNAYHTGDPIFPVLFSALGLEDWAFWDADYAASMKDYLALRIDQISWWERWLAYPVAATLFPSFAMEAGRVGLGPYFLMIAPFALVGAWHQRHKIKGSLLAPAALTVILYYVFWLGFGGIPKVRHLLPILPIALVCLAVGSVKAIEAWPHLRLPIGLAMILSLAVNMGVVGFFSRPYVAYAMSGFDREVFLTNNVNGYPVAAWLNQQDGIDKVLLTYRAFRYYVSPASYLAFPRIQKLIEARVGRVEVANFWKHMRDLGISHILTDRPTTMSQGTASVDSAIKELARTGCLGHMNEIQTLWRTSRTLPSLDSGQRPFDVWRLDAVSCPYDKSK